MTKKTTVAIIDAHALIHRAFHALPPLSTKDGLMVNAVYGFLTILFKMLRTLKPTHVAVVFDAPGSTFRHKLYKAYKATRKKQPDELYLQIPIIQEIVEAFNFATFSQTGYEADDLIGTLTQVLPKNVNKYIVTGDMDALQLVDDHTFVYAMRKGVSDTVIYDPAEVERKLNGLTPQQVVDYKALRGDTSDNIPGIRGIGEKTATTLLLEHGNLEAVLKHAADYKGALREKLAAGRADAELSKTLATIDRAVPLKVTLDQLAIQPYDRAKIVQLVQKLEFKSLLNHLPDMPVTSGQLTLGSMMSAATPADASGVEKDWLGESSYILIESIVEAETLIAKLEAVNIFALDTETTSLDPLQTKLVGFSIALRAGEAYFIKGELVHLFKTVLENPAIGKVGHNIKFDYKVLLATSQITVQPIAYDTMLASYVLNPGSRGHGLDALAFVEFGYEMMSYTEMVGKGKTAQLITEVPIRKLAFYAAEDADYTWRLYETLRPRVAQAKLEAILQLEVDLIPVLAAMELAGVTIDVPFLRTMSKELAHSVANLEKKIYKLAGSEFNISSPKQLKEILFDRLHIATSGLAKIKTGVSTAASELEKMRGLHPIIDLISDYREVTKLKSTYVDALPELVNPKTKRIHTSFNQTIAATGRLSSTEPNLQNIPIRTELGREIRKAFVASPGKLLISLDYSQIELRVIAHLADDEAFIQGFLRGADIHTQTAAEMNNVAENQVTKELRRAAKSINFGILYGMGAYGLARDAKISNEEARVYLDKYFVLHPAIQRYVEETKAFARKFSYVETLYGRRRYLPDINSGMPLVRAAAERAAINMPA
ncbi:MAG: hypothetical protein ACD_43C00050G0004, partial [uncultured bacterium]